MNPLARNGFSNATSIHSGAAAVGPWPGSVPCETQKVAGSPSAARVAGIRSWLLEAVTFACGAAPAGPANG